MSPDDSELRRIVHTALLHPSPLARYRPGPFRRETHGTVTLIAEGTHGRDFSQVIVLGSSSAREVLTLAASFFPPGEDYSILVEAACVPVLEGQLRRRGWLLDEEEPALVLFPLPARLAAPPPDLAIRAVVDSAGMADFMAVAETPSPFLPSLTAARDPAVALLVGYREGHPVATARLTCLGGIVEILGVVTVPEMRRRGYATALTWAAVQAGAARGCTAAVLTSTPEGYPVYRRMGFQPSGVYRTYVLPE